MSAYFEPTLNPEDESRMSKGDIFSYGRHKSKETEKMVKYMDLLRLKKLTPKETVSTMLEENAHKPDKINPQNYRRIKMSDPLFVLLTGKTKNLSNSFPNFNLAIDYANKLAGRKISPKEYKHLNAIYFCKVIIKVSTGWGFNSETTKLLKIDIKFDKPKSKYIVNAYFIS